MRRERATRTSPITNGGSDRKTTTESAVLATPYCAGVKKYAMMIVAPAVQILFRSHCTERATEPRTAEPARSTSLGIARRLSGGVIAPSANRSSSNPTHTPCSALCRAMTTSRHVAMRAEMGAVAPELSRIAALWGTMVEHGARHDGLGQMTARQGDRDGSQNPTGAGASACSGPALCRSHKERCASVLRKLLGPTKGGVSHVIGQSNNSPGPVAALREGSRLLRRDSPQWAVPFRDLLPARHNRSPKSGKASTRFRAGRGIPRTRSDILASVPGSGCTQRGKGSSSDYSAGPGSDRP